MFQDIYALAITIDHCYCKYDCKCYYTKQIEKKAFKSHFWKQDKAFSAGNAIALQNKANTYPAALSKLFPSSMLSTTSKKQSDSLQVDLSSKLANNSKLTSNKCKMYLKNNLYLYCSVKDYKLDSYFKKQTTVISKGCNASAAVSKKSLER